MRVLPLLLGISFFSAPLGYSSTQINPILSSPQSFQTQTYRWRQKAIISSKKLACLEISPVKIDPSQNQEIKDALEEVSFAQRFGNPLIEMGAWLSVGNAYDKLNQFDQAIEAFQKSLAVAKKVNNLEFQGQALFNLGFVQQRQCQYDKAIAFYQQAAALHQANKDAFLSAYTLSQLGLAQLENHQAAQAAKSLEKSIENFESIRLGLPDQFKISIFKLQSLSYRLLQEALVIDHQPNKALEIAERGRARAFVELLGKRIKGVPKLDAPKLDQIQKIAKDHKATLVEYSFIRNSTSEDKNENQQPTLLIWVIKPTGEVTLRQTTLNSLTQPLEKVVTDARNAIFRAKDSNIELQRLHQLLIQPIADLLPTDPNTHVVFIPQASLFLVPFAALQDAEGHYLIEKHTILSAPAIQVLDLTRQQRQRLKGQGSLVVGFPRTGMIVGNPARIQPPLAEAEKEAIAIAALLKTQPITGEQATKATILAKMPDAQIIHLATHAIYIEEGNLGLQSSLAFASTPQNNGSITAGEILDLKLNANLAVLSACNTGRGEITGDGVIGLSRSFVGAGVPSLVVSLWSINDESTTVLMTQFYQNLLQNPDKAQALRQAMLSTAKQYPLPKHWAAFSLIGEAE
jgi:CHAT domain-containing protein